MAYAYRARITATLEDVVSVVAKRQRSCGSLEACGGTGIIEDGNIGDKEIAFSRVFIAERPALIRWALSRGLCEVRQRKQANAERVTRSAADCF
jgi:hypothetical protein